MLKYFFITLTAILICSCGGGAMRRQEAAPYNSYRPTRIPPASRFYSNPYSIPPTNYPYQYYDSDYHYVPPTYYGSEGESIYNKDEIEEMFGNVTSDKQ